jgi:hypothetical protein
MVVLALGFVTPKADAQGIQILGAWHCYDDGCAWATAPNMTTFDTNNHWILDRGDGHPSLNLVVLAFADPLKLLNGTNDSGNTNGVPNGMTATVVQYFESKGIRVAIAIGGQTYTSDWDTALSTNPTQLGINAANLARSLNVSIEIDYENTSSANISGLQAFVNAYRSVIPYDATGTNIPARLTIDLGVGDQYLSSIAQWAATSELQESNPVLDYANAMVLKASTSVSTYESDWLQHIDGYSRLKVPPVAPARLTGSFFIQGTTNCTTWSGSQQQQAASWVETVLPGGAGTTDGMSGLMFWALGCPSSHSSCTYPPNTCQGGLGVASTNFSIATPMPALRQQ